jgi:hypothetical protein
MVLSIHIIIAVTSLLVGGLAAIRAARHILLANYGLIAGTFVSGTLLIIQQPAHLATACMSGLTYLAVAASLTVIARRRIAHETT